MKILIDGIEREKVTLASKEIPAYIARLKEELRKEDKAIEKVDYDGTEINASSESLQETDYAAVKELNIITKNIDAVIRDMLKEASEILPHLIKALQSICEGLRKDKVSESLDMYIKVLPSLRLVLLGLLSAQETRKVLADINVQEVNAVVQEVNQALRDKDYTLFCDVVEYRLLTQLQHAYKTLFQKDRV